MAASAPGLLTQGDLGTMEFRFAFLGDDGSPSGEAPAYTGSLASHFQTAPSTTVPPRVPLRADPLASLPRKGLSVPSPSIALADDGLLTAAAFVAKGAAICEVEPILCVQSLESAEQGPPACDYCCRHLGDASSQLRHQLRHRPCARGFDGELPALASYPWLGSAALRGRPCARNCGAVYCGEACERAAGLDGHSLLCAGGLDAVHPLVEFKRLGVCTHESFLIAARVMAMLLMARARRGAAQPGDRHARDADRRAADLEALLALPEGDDDKADEFMRLPPWWALRPGANSAAVEYYQDQCAEGLALLAAGVQATAAGRLPSTLPPVSELLGEWGWAAWLQGAASVERFGRLLTALEHRLIPLSVDPPLLKAYCQELSSATAMPPETFRAAVVPCAQLVEGYRAPLAPQSSVAIERDAAHVSALAHSTPGELFPCPVRALALIPVGSVARHSCVPTIQVDVRDSWPPAEGRASSTTDAPPRLVARIVALRDVDVGAELTLARVPTALGLEARMAALRARLPLLAQGPGKPCACDRCSFERARVTSLPDAVLRAIAGLAVEEGRWRQAETCLELLISRNSTDGGLYHLLATTWVAAGRWAEAWRVWKRGLAVDPDHPHLAAFARKCTAYGPCTPARDPAQGPHPWTAVSTEVQVFETNVPLATADECRAFVAAANATADRAGGWTTQRHYSVPTTDMPVLALPGEMLRWFQAFCSQRVVPTLATQFGLQACTITVHDAFVVKYDARAQRLLPLHADEAQISATIALNPREQFTGGGTFFQALQRSFCPEEPGQMVSFDARLVHGGDPITSGHRYILALFLACA